jgi:hypothetical protein
VHGSIREEAVMIGNWVDEIEEDVRTVLNERGSLSARELGRRLGVSEARSHRVARDPEILLTAA